MASSSSCHGGLRLWMWLALLLLMFMFILLSSSLLFVVHEKSGNDHDNSHSNSHIRHDIHHHYHLQRRRDQTILLPQEPPQQERQQTAAATTSTTAKKSSSDANVLIKQGCLQSVLPDDDDDYWTTPRRRKTRRRVCSSDDTDETSNNASDTSSCRTPDFAYPEMRIYAQNWESSIFAAWLLQIILSEMLDVPTTIETGFSSSSSSSSSASRRRLSLYDDDDSQQNQLEHVVVANNDNVDKRSGGLEKQALQHAIRYNQDCTLACRSGADGSSSSSSSDAKNHSYSTTTSRVEYYEPCAHYIPEIWKPATWMQEEMMILQGSDETSANTRLVVRLAPNGLVGQEGGWYIPKFTAQRDPTLLSYMGLQGPANRAKMAEMFLWPTTWQYYCDHIAPTRCYPSSSTEIYNGKAYVHPDDNEHGVVVASRPPANATEGARFFVPGGLFMGHFRRTAQNDCTLNPTTCTGHLASYPCSWDSLPTAQLYHLDIALQGNGVEVDDIEEATSSSSSSSSSSSATMARGYQISQLQELWLAANATKNNLIMTWFSPETLFQEFLGTDAEMVRSVLPPATQQCLDHRGVVEGVGGGGDGTVNNQCSAADIQTRAGGSSPLGVCDNPVNPLQKLWLDASSSSSSSLLSNTAKAATTTPLLESPAHYVFESFHLSNLQLGDMFDYVKRDNEKNDSNNDTTTTSPRQAICQWAADNIEFLESFIPESYPRAIAQHQNDEKDSVYYSGLMYACIGVGAFAVLVIMITGFNVVDKKDQQVMQSAPLGFLFLILTGSLIVAMGAILMGGFPPSNATCVAEMWLVNVGFAIGFVPLIYKLTAIQHAAKDHAERKRRVTPECGGLVEAVILAIAIIMIILFLWTIYDPPRKSVASYQLAGTLTEDGETIVDVRYYCSSEHVFWKYLPVAWNLLLLLHAAVLGFATANVPQDFNERAILTALVHCHILFVLLWLISLLLSPIVDETTLTGFRSMIFSIDSIFTMIVYVFPKFVVRDPEPTTGSDKDSDSEVPTSSSLGFSQPQPPPPLGPIARCIACISGVSSCEDYKYQPVDSDDSALESKQEQAPVEMATNNAKTPQCNNSEGLNDDETLPVVSQLRASVQKLEEERRALRSDVEKKNMAISMLEEEVGTLMEQIMGGSGSDVQNETADEMCATVRELQEEGRDLRSFFKSQDISLAQLMSEETKLLQKLESQRSVVSPPKDYKEAKDAVWRWDKENDVIKLDTWDTTDEEEI